MSTEVNIGAGRAGGVSGPRPRRRLMMGGGLAVVLAVAIVVGILAGGGGSHHHSAASHKYGGAPAYLKGHTALPNLNAAVPASAAHPQLQATEGQEMAVTLDSGAVADVTAVGPAFSPAVSAAAQSGTLSSGSAIPSQFDVTLIGKGGTVPLRPADFSILTGQGQLVHPAMTLKGGGTVPSVVRAGQNVTVVLSAKLTEGDGTVRWAPQGPKVVGAWLFQLELD